MAIDRRLRVSQSQCLQLARKQAPTMAYLNVCNADVLPVAASMRPDIGLMESFP